MNATIPLPIRPGQRILVVGMGASGLKTAEVLRIAGVHITLTDDRHTTHPDYPYVAPENVDAANFDFICLSPGIVHKAPRPHPIVQKAYAAGTRLTSDVDLFFESGPKAFTMGVTGTNGKSSTVSLIHFALEKLGIRTALGGNIGVPILTLPWLTSEDVYVIELSSYQLETTPSLTLDLAILLAITPDHLDRYDAINAYADTKFNIFKGAKRCLYNQDDARQAAFVAKQNDPARFIPYSLKERVRGGFFLVKGTLYNDHNGACKAYPVHEHLPAPTLLCAFAALSLKGFGGEAILDAAKGWPGLSHRYERIFDSHGCTWINDSKATNVEATAFAFKQSGDQSVFWIAGGKLKEHTNFDLLIPHLPRIKRAFLIGNGVTTFARFLSKHNVAHDVCGDLDAAVTRARAAIKSEQNAIVLLSPAAASFDQYQNFEARGDHFKALVRGDIWMQKS